MPQRVLTALPVYNEASHVGRVLDLTLRHAQDVLVVDDGSTDGTSALLARRRDIQIVSHPRNQGYGAALRTAFHFALQAGYDLLVTIDCDGQHEPQRIPRFIEACAGADVVSGSRYLAAFVGQSPPPEDRRRINRLVTRWINRHLGLVLTDAFCGFKAYRTSVLRQLRLTETGYAMPLELWVELARLGVRVVEEPVPLVYLDPRRSFGGALDDARTRLIVYREVLLRSMSTRDMAIRPAECPGWSLPPCPERCWGGQPWHPMNPFDRPGPQAVARACGRPEGAA